MKFLIHTSLLTAGNRFSALLLFPVILAWFTINIWLRHENLNLDDLASNYSDTLKTIQALFRHYIKTPSFDLSR